MGQCFAERPYLQFLFCSSSFATPFLPFSTLPFSNLQLATFAVRTFAVGTFAVLFSLNCYATFAVGAFAVDTFAVPHLQFLMYHHRVYKYACGAKNTL